MICLKYLILIVLKRFKAFSVQLAIAANFDTGKSAMVFNYLPKVYSLTLSSQRVLIGYNINGSVSYFNQFSNAFSSVSSVNSFAVFSDIGNSSN